MQPLESPGDAIGSVQGPVKRFAGPGLLLAIGVVLAYVAPHWGIAALGVGFVWLAALSLPGALAVYIVASPFIFGLTVLHHHVNMSDVMAIILAVRLLVTTWRAQGIALWRSWWNGPFFWPLALLIVLSVLSLASAIAPAVTVIKILEYLEFFVVLVAVVHQVPLTEKHWKIIVGALFLLATGLAIYGLYQFIFEVGPAANVVDVYHIRADGVFGQPNPFGGFESMVFVFMAALMAYGPKWGRRWWMWVALSLVSLSVIVSFSRGAWVASVAAIGMMGIVAWAVRGRKMIHRYFVFPAIGIPILSYILVDFLGKLDISHKKLSTLSRQTTGGRLTSTVGAVFNPKGHIDTARRLLIWKDALKAIHRHPVLGVGLGGFHHFAQLHPVRGMVIAPPMAHNLYLEWGADLGVLGIVVALWLEWAWVRHSVGVLKAQAKTLDPFVFAMALGAFGAIVSFIVHDWVDLMIDHGVIVPLILGLAVVWTLWDRGKKTRARGEDPVS